MENIAGKNRPVATNFQFLKIFCPSGTALLKLCRVSEVLLLGQGPSILLAQDRAAAQTPHWGVCCYATAVLLGRVCPKPCLIIRGENNIQKVSVITSGKGKASLFFFKELRYLLPIQGISGENKL